MKLIKLTIALLFVVGLSVTSCKKDCHHKHHKGHDCGQRQGNDHDADDVTTSSSN